MSEVWQIFIKTDCGLRAQCQLCNKSYKNSGTKTTKLWNHLRAKHKQKFKELDDERKGFSGSLLINDNDGVDDENKMYLNTKRNINVLFDKVIFKIPKVNLVKLSVEDMTRYQLNSQRSEYEPVTKKQKYDTCSEKSIMESNLSVEGEHIHTFESQFKNTSNEGERNFSKVGKVWCCDMSKLIETSKLEKYYEIFDVLSKKPHTSRNYKNNPAVTIPINNITRKSEEDITKILSVIKPVYRKYFHDRTRQINTIVMTNILNILWTCNTCHKERMDHVTRKIKLKNKNLDSADKILLKHLNVLKSKFKQYFKEIMSNIVHTDLQLALKAFLLNIFTKIEVLHHPKSNGNIFENISLLIQDILKNDILEPPIPFTVLQSKAFHVECIDLIRIIQERKCSDPNNIIDDISFMSLVTNQKYFQTVINAVVNLCNEDLSQLINHAASECFINLKINSTGTIPTSLNIKKNTKTEAPLTSDTIDENLTRRRISHNATTSFVRFQPTLVTVPQTNQNTFFIVQQHGNHQTITTTENSIGTLQFFTVQNNIVQTSMGLIRNSEVSYQSSTISYQTAAP